MVYGQSFNLYGALTSTTSLPSDGAFPPAGTVTFTSGGLNFGTAAINVPVTFVSLPGCTGPCPAGYATLALPQNLTSPLGAGSYNVNVTATYAGDPLYATSSGPGVLSINVSKGNTTTTITAIPPVTGQANVRVNVTPVAPSSGFPTGSVQLIANGSTVVANGQLVIATGAANCGTGVAICSVATFSVPPNSYSANYLGDANFNTSNTQGGVANPITGAGPSSTIDFTWVPRFPSRTRRWF